MRYQFGGVVQTKTNLILWNQYIVGPPELYIIITSRATLMPSEDVRKTANWDFYWPYSYHLLYIFHFLLTTFSFNNFNFLFVFLFSLFG